MCLDFNLGLLLCYGCKRYFISSFRLSNQLWLLYNFVYYDLGLYFSFRGRVCGHIRTNSRHVIHGRGVGQHSRQGLTVGITLDGWVDLSFSSAHDYTPA